MIFRHISDGGVILRLFEDPRSETPEPSEPSEPTYKMLLDLPITHIVTIIKVYIEGRLRNSITSAPDPG